MHPRWAVYRLVMVTLAVMMVVMLEGGSSGGYGVDGCSCRCGGGNDDRNNDGYVSGGCSGDGGGDDAQWVLWALDQEKLAV